MPCLRTPHEVISWTDPWSSLRNPAMHGARRPILLLRAFTCTAIPALFAQELVGQNFLMSDDASWNTCVGNFYDSGGVENNYDNGEDFTATLCPAGGAGSGVATSVRFVSFVAERNDDQLVIHDGTTTGAPILATGDEGNSLAGQTFTATGPSGCLTFHWTSDNPANAAGWVAEVITGLDAGTSASLSVCSNQTAFPLLDALDGDPDGGGTWTGPGGPHGPQYDPATDPGGVYTYTTMGGSACEDQATVTITKVPGPDAGDDGTVQICGNDPPEDLIGSLGGTPASGGTWTGPAGPHDGSFDPATDGPGDYIHTVTGTAPCPNATATVTVVLTDPDAGTNANLSVCRGQPSLALIDALGGSPDAGGSWMGPAGPHGPQYDPATEPGGAYTYTVMDGSCAASATLTITNVPGPVAGQDGTLTVCGSSTPVSLINSLGGAPGNGGSWTGPNGPHDGSYDPGTDLPGDYIYTVTGTSPCPNASAMVAVAITGPDAGTSANLTVCSGESPFLLADALGGSPAVGGAWTGPEGMHGIQYDPGSEPGGAYTYTVTNGSCVATATLTITNVPGPDAGDDGTLQICDNGPAVALINSLGGSPASGGAWTGPAGAHDGSFDPATDPAGDYTYTVTGTLPCSNASATVEVVISVPNAGTNANLTVCTGQPSFSLFDALGGNPDTAGSWAGPSGPHGPDFDPGSDPGGVYTYTVTDGSCLASATVNITSVPGPDAGDDGTLATCENNPPVDLINSLGGTPAVGGTWTGPAGPHDGGFDPAVDQPGNYTYTVTGTAPCPNASATVAVVITGPNAGGNASLSVCSGQSAFPLFEALAGNPDAGGTWTGPAGPHGPQFNPGTDQGGVYTYTVMDGSCLAFATVTVTNVPGPDAGDNGTLLICEGSPPADLFISLEGSPEGGGTWTGPAGPHDGSYDPATDQPGNYTYTLMGTAPCSDASATVIVVITGPDPGTSASLTVCTGQIPFPLFEALDGTPDGGGSWAGPGGPHGPQYSPGADPDGVYTYTVTDANCAASATVTITNIPGPDAGDDGTLLICVVGQVVDLINSLEGSPTSGGTWSGPDGPHDGSFNPAQGPPGDYTYTVAGTAPCPNATATVMVVITGPDAGTSTSLTLCSGQSSFLLFDALDGSPDVGGSWTGPAGPHGTGYDPGTDPGGVYTYLVLDGGMCSDTASVTVINRPGPDAGDDGTLLICDLSAPVDLINSLAGTPGAGGTWTGPTGPHGGSYDPATDVEGDYTYTVAGVAPCPYATAIVSVILTGLPDAGTDGALLACDTVTALDPISGLGGTPDAGGTWADLDASGALSNGTLNTNGLSAGTYRFLYTVAVTGCGTDEAMVSVRVVGSVEVTDVSRQCDDAEGTLVIAFIITGGDPASYTVLGIPGTLGSLAPFLFTSDPLPDSLAYTVEVSDQNSCGSARLVVPPCSYGPDILIPSFFSPNGDGINEAFLIPNLENFPGNEIHIFNRWGSEVFHATNYHRTSGWDGSTTGNTWGHGELPSGTYYYVLEVSTGTKAYKGFLHLQR